MPVIVEGDGIAAQSEKTAKLVSKRAEAAIAIQGARATSLSLVALNWLTSEID
jgi:hypothetical protein